MALAVVVFAGLTTGCGRRGSGAQATGGAAALKKAILLAEQM